MDKRKNNGGHSTKSKSGLDKRQNKYREALENAATVEDVEKVIKTVFNKAVKDEDMQAAKLFLEYYLGKPKDSLDITTGGETMNKEFTVEDAAKIVKALEEEL